MRNNSEISLPEQRDSNQQGTNSERQDRRSMSSDERTRQHTRNLRLVTTDTASTSNTDHPTPASTLEQQRDQDHQQPESQQGRRNIVSRMWRCMTAPYRHFNNLLDDMYSDPVYQYLWADDRTISRMIAEGNDQDPITNVDNLQELIGMKLDGVKNSTWTEFSIYLLSKYDENLYDADGPHENKDTRLLFDVLKGGAIRSSDGRVTASHHAADSERNEDDYKKLTTLVRNEWKMYKAGELLNTDLSEVRPDSWLQFSHDLLEKHTEGHINPKYLKDILQDHTADLGTNTVDLVSIQERKKPEYTTLISSAQNEWKNWKRKKAGELLDRDLSKVRPEIWAKFSEDVLSTYEDKNEDSDMLLKDILQGGVLCIKDTVRESDETYKNMKSDVRDKWDKRVE